MRKRRGYHPHRALEVRDRKEAHLYVREEVVCAGCGTRGGHAHGGHATICRRREDGSIEVLDAIRAKCRCGHQTPFFFLHYGSDLAEVLGMESLTGVVETMARRKEIPDDGTYVFVSSRGTAPGSWLPEELMHEDPAAHGIFFCSCGARVPEHREERQNQIVGIPYAPQSGEWHGLMERGWELWCRECEKIRCLQCCLLYEWDAHGEELGKEYDGMYFAHCPVCKDVLIL